MWRGGESAGGSEDVYIPNDHASMDVLNAIRDASSELWLGCTSADKRKGEEPRAEALANGLKCFDSSFVNINHAYTALLLYAHRKRLGGQCFKLKSICLAGDLGGRGVNFKPHGYGNDPSRDSWIVAPHQGYLTDMFFMFDAVVNRQITTHGEYVLQAIGRLCTLVRDDMLACMEKTPPRLWTSHSCYNIIRTFAKGVDQWVRVMCDKRPGEAIKETLVRNIKAKPEEMAELWLIYFQPTTDARWAKKESWVRPSRLMSADRIVGEAVRAAPRMPRTPISPIVIHHNPDSDSRKRCKAAISRAEERASSAGSASGDDDAPEPCRTRRRTQREPNETQMKDRFDTLYELHPELCVTNSGEHMPKFNQVIWTTWDVDSDEYYRATVTDIEYHDEQRGFLYEIQFDTEDDGTLLPNSLTRHADTVYLDLGMSNWRYSDPRMSNA